MKAVLETMKEMTPIAYIGGKDSEDGEYVAGTDKDLHILYLVHFDWEEVEELIPAIEQGKVKEWILSGC